MTGCLMTIRSYDRLKTYDRFSKLQLPPHLTATWLHFGPWAVGLNLWLLARFHGCAITFSSVFTVFQQKSLLDKLNEDLQPCDLLIDCSVSLNDLYKNDYNIDSVHMVTRFTSATTYTTKVLGWTVVTNQGLSVLLIVFFTSQVYYAFIFKL